MERSEVCNPSGEVVGRELLAETLDRFVGEVAGFLEKERRAAESGDAEELLRLAGERERLNEVIEKLGALIALAERRGAVPVWLEERLSSLAQEAQAGMQATSELRGKILEGLKVLGKVKAAMATYVTPQPRRGGLLNRQG